MISAICYSVNNVVMAHSHIYLLDFLSYVEHTDTPVCIISASNNSLTSLSFIITSNLLTYDYTYCKSTYFLTIFNIFKMKIPIHTKNLLFDFTRVKKKRKI